MTQAQEVIVHATAVAFDIASAADAAGGAGLPDMPPGVMVRGGSGSGKSDLALRLIDGGAALVADDRTVLRRVGDVVLLSAPDAIQGRLEVRGLGIVPFDAVPRARLTLLVDLVAAGTVERLPPPRVESVLGLAFPVVALDPFENSAAAKVRLAVRAAACGILDRLE